MKFAVYKTVDGSIKGFYVAPASMVDLQCMEGEDFYLDCPEEATHIIDNTPVTIPVEKPPEQIVFELTSALERHYDSVARIKKYDNRLTCALRAGYAGVFQSEGQAFAIWMDNCNAYGYQVLADCQNALRAIPTPEELIAELPAAPW